MDRARSVFTIFIVSILILGGLLHLSNYRMEAAGSDTEYGPGTRASTIEISDGTEIRIDPGQMVNGDYYYPVPIGSTVLSANVTFSNVPYTPGKTDYSKEAWLNVGNAPKEYSFGISGERMFGYWGRQNQSSASQPLP